MSRLFIYTLIGCCRLIVSMILITQFYKSMEG